MPTTIFFATAVTEGMPLRPKPFDIGLEWYRYFLTRSPGFDGTEMTAAEFELLVNQSVEPFGPVFNSNDPDLSAFRDHGGKVIILHGLTDEIIPHEGSVDYYKQVQKQIGGAEQTAKFARLFLVPGVAQLDPNDLPARRVGGGRQGSGSTSWRSP
jgi:feruloyl esterase